MKKESTIMTSLAKRAGTIALCTALGMATIGGTAYAYFTDHAKASGGHTLELSYHSTITESVSGGQKLIEMYNDGEMDIMVRVQLFYGTGINENISISVTENDDWKLENGMYVWTKILRPGDHTSYLEVNVSAPNEDVDLENFDVTVIGQTSPAYYDEDGNPVAYLWSDATFDNNGDQN